MKKAVAYTIVDDRYYYPVGAHIFVNTFKKFHPDIPLVVYRQDMIDKVFKEKNINFYMAKPSFAKLLYEEYELVVNIDADTVVTDRMTEVFDKPYDIGAASNLNDYENSSLDSITEAMYLQAGLVGSRSKLFWDIWEEANKQAMKFIRQENDVLNLVAYKDKRLQDKKLVIFDKDKDYYGCKSLNREPEFYIANNKLMCRGEKVVAYHWAKGAIFPKLDFDNPEIGFAPEVRVWLKQLSTYGTTVTLL